MPKKQLQNARILKEVSNIKLRRSKPAPVKTPEYLTDEDEICLETEQHEQGADAAQEDSPQDIEFEELTTAAVDAQRERSKQKKTTAKQHTKKPKKPSALVNFQNERKAFQQYVNEQRALLAKERMEHLEQVKKTTDQNKISSSYRMKLMSIL